MTLALVGRDIYMRHADTDGRSYVQCHRVWNADIFVAARNYDNGVLNIEARNSGKPANARSEQITEDQYRKERA